MGQYGFHTLISPLVCKEFVVKKLLAALGFVAAATLAVMLASTLAHAAPAVTSVDAQLVR